MGDTESSKNDDIENSNFESTLVIQKKKHKKKKKKIKEKEENLILKNLDEEASYIEILQKSYDTLERDFEQELAVCTEKNPEAANRIISILQDRKSFRENPKNVYDNILIRFGSFFCFYEHKKSLVKKKEK